MVAESLEVAIGDGASSASYRWLTALLYSDVQK